MEPAITTEYAGGDRLEIPSLRTFDRISGATVVAAAGGLFALLALAQTAPGYQIGYVMAGASLWWALYIACLPRIKVALGPDGIEFADMSMAIFFRHPRHQGTWRDVVEVSSRAVASKYGSYIETWVKVRVSGAPLETRRFSVTSKDPGYYAFLKALKDHIDPSALAAGGMGIEPDEMRTVAGQMFQGRLWLLFAMSIVAVVMIIFTYFARR